MTTATLIFYAVLLSACCFSNGSGGSERSRRSVLVTLPDTELTLAAASFRATLLSWSGEWLFTVTEFPLSFIGLNLHITYITGKR